MLSENLSPHIPENCNLWKDVHLSPQSSVKGIHDCSSQSHGIGCMLRQHPFHYAEAALYATGERHLRRFLCQKKIDVAKIVHITMIGLGFVLIQKQRIERTSQMIVMCAIVGRINMLKKFPKFRAWVNTYCGFGIDSTGTKEIWKKFMEYKFHEIDFDDKDCIGKRGIWFDFDEADFMLYVGIKDKNGKKIYEKDIVKTKYGRKCLVKRRMTDCFCGFDLIPIESENKSPDEYDLWRPDNLEVIGNVYENEEYAKYREDNSCEKKI